MLLGKLSRTFQTAPVLRRAPTALLTQVNMI